MENLRAEKTVPLVMLSVFNMYYMNKIIAICMRKATSESGNMDLKVKGMVQIWVENIYESLPQRC